MLQELRAWPTMAERSPTSKPNPGNWRCIKCNSEESGPRPESTVFCAKCASETRRVTKNAFCINCGAVLLKPDQNFCQDCGKNPKTGEGPPQKKPTREEYSSDYRGSTTFQQHLPKRIVPETMASRSGSYSPAHEAKMDTPPYEGNEILSCDFLRIIFLQFLILSSFQCTQSKLRRRTNGGQFSR